jgi:adenylylsulfate kinase
MLKILIMGLPGAGKTTLASALHDALIDHDMTVDWLNADAIREAYNDWDFSAIGRIRQATRMNSLASTSTADIVIADFVAPTNEIRNIFAADYTVWVDTIDEGRFPDTNAIFEPPVSVDLRIKNYALNESVNCIMRDIKNLWTRQNALY